MAVPGLALGDHLSCGHVQGGKQRGSAVPDVVMGDSLHVTQAHGQQRLGAVEGLDLRLFVNAKHYRLVRRIQVQANDVPNLLDKERIGGELERFLPVGLHRDGLQPAVNRCLGDPSRCSQSPSAPMGAAVGWFGLQGPVDDLGHLVVLVGARTTGAELIVQTHQAEVSVALAPLADGHARQPHPRGNGGVGFAGTAGQNCLATIR